MLIMFTSALLREDDVPLPMLCLTTIVSTAICKESGGSLVREVCAAICSTRMSTLHFVPLS